MTRGRVVAAASAALSVAIVSFGFGDQPYAANGLHLKKRMTPATTNAVRGEITIPIRLKREPRTIHINVDNATKQTQLLAENQTSHTEEANASEGLQHKVAETESEPEAWRNQEFEEWVKNLALDEDEDSLATRLPANEGKVEDVAVARGVSDETNSIMGSDWNSEPHIIVGEIENSSQPMPRVPESYTLLQFRAEKRLKWFPQGKVSRGNFVEIVDIPYSDSFQYNGIGCTVLDQVQQPINGEDANRSWKVFCPEAPATPSSAIVKSALPKYRIVEIPESYMKYEGEISTAISSGDQVYVLKGSGGNNNVENHVCKVLGNKTAAYGRWTKKWRVKCLGVVTANGKKTKTVKSWMMGDYEESLSKIYSVDEDDMIPLTDHAEYRAAKQRKNVLQEFGGARSGLRIKVEGLTNPKHSHLNGLQGTLLGDQKHDDMGMAFWDVDLEQPHGIVRIREANMLPISKPFWEEYTPQESEMQSEPNNATQNNEFQFLASQLENSLPYYKHIKDATVGWLVEVGKLTNSWNQRLNGLKWTILKQLKSSDGKQLMWRVYFARTREVYDVSEDKLVKYEAEPIPFDAGSAVMVTGGVYKEYATKMVARGKDCQLVAKAISKEDSDDHWFVRCGSTGTKFHVSKRNLVPVHTMGVATFPWDGPKSGMRVKVAALKTRLDGKQGTLVEFDGDSSNIVGKAVWEVDFSDGIGKVKVLLDKMIFMPPESSMAEA